MKKDFTLFKAILFILGLIVIGTAAILLRGFMAFGTERYFYIFACVVVVYVAFFFPLLMNSFPRENAAKVFVGGAVYYRGFITYVVLTAGLIAASFYIPVLFAILAQSCLTIILLIYILLACFTANFIEAVGKEEQEKVANVLEIRKKMKNLSVLADGLGDENKAVKDAIKKLANRAENLSPSNAPEAKDMELKILMLVEGLLADNFFTNSQNYSSEFVLGKIHELELCMNQRKITN